MAYKLIQTHTLGSAQNEIVFSVIPQTYRDLSLFVSTYSTRGVSGVESFQIKPNNTMSGSIQRRLYAFGTNVSPQFGTDTGANEMYTPFMGADASDFYNNVWVYLPGYASTSFIKTFFSENTTDNNSTANWMSAWTAHCTGSVSAVSSITLSGASFNFQPGTIASLYGVS